MPQGVVMVKTRVEVRTRIDGDIQLQIVACPTTRVRPPGRLIVPTARRVRLRKIADASHSVQKLPQLPGTYWLIGVVADRLPALEHLNKRRGLAPRVGGPALARTRGEKGNDILRHRWLYGRQRRNLP